MRIHVWGSSPAAGGLASVLRAQGYHVSDQFPSYTVVIHDGPVTQIVVDTPDAIFGRLVTHQVGALAPNGGVFVQAAGGNQNDRQVVITVPEAQDASAHAVEHGVMRALDLVTGKSGVPLGARALSPVPRVPTSAPSPELFMNVVDVLKAHQIATIQPLVDGVTALGAQIRGCATRADLNTLSAAVSAPLEAIHGAVGLVSSDLVTARAGLFADLVAYDQRKRWWQVWR